jgi:hypothetical protein
MEQAALSHRRPSRPSTSPVTARTLQSHEILYALLYPRHFDPVPLLSGWIVKGSYRPKGQRKRFETVTLLQQRRSKQSTSARRAGNAR